jgi:chitin disaccharide deacetylase
MTQAPHPPCLLVNADDYGYFRCVSRGILEGAARGIVTATGVIANREDLEGQSSRLLDCRALDVGVHLNLTWGVPLTARMRKKLTRSSGMFPGKYSMTLAVLAGRVQSDDVAEEWRAQIDRCQVAGLEPSFLNSHEHIHMLPALFVVASALAAQYGIRHIRFTAADSPARFSAGALMRNGIMKGLGMLSRQRLATPVASFLGLDASGRLDEGFFRRVLPTLQPGRIYELMCHPGYLDREEVRDPRLLAYHDWEGELATLTSPRVKDLLNAYGVRAIGYRDLDVVGGRLVAKAPSLASTRHA